MKPLTNDPKFSDLSGKVTWKEGMNDGGPAFPFYSGPNGSQGMSLRIYVATACLQAILSNPVLCENTARENKMPEAQSLAMILRSLEIADQLLAIETENRFKRHGTEWKLNPEWAKLESGPPPAGQEETK